MSKTPETQLSRREREIMDVLYRLEKASVSEVLEAMTDPPTRTSVRTHLSILEEKGHLKHTLRGREFIYQPIRPRKRVGRSALRRVLDTFFEGSLEKAIAAHLSDPSSKLSPEDMARLEELIQESKKRGQ